jgi:hypothetical protein
MLAFSQPQRSYNHETIRNGARAYVCAFNLDLRGRNADWRQSRDTAASYIQHVEHIEHIEHFAC